MTSFLRDTTRGLAKDVVEPIKETTSAVDNVLENLISALDKDTSKILHVYSYDRPTKGIKEKTCIAFSNIKKDDLKLSDIRDLLLGEKVLKPRLLSSSFCNQRGAIIQDATLFKTYLEILHDTSKTIGGVAGDNEGGYRVYLKSKTIEGDPYHALVNKTVDVGADNKVQGLPTTAQPKAPDPPTSFSHNIFLNPNTTFSIVHPSDMSEKNWSVVMRSNSLLHSYRVVDLGDKGGKFVERSLYPSFVLKPRGFWNYQINDTTQTGSITQQKQMIRVPRFRIDDDSYIRQYVQKKSVSRAIAEECLSETDAKFAIEGGAFGYSASASASWGESKSSSSASSTSEDTRFMTIIYNFPRVVVDFEPTELDLSDEMKKDLGKVDSVEAIDMFKNKYGRFFATKVQLGGRLHSSEESVGTDAASRSAQAKSMRASAAFSFSAPVVQASGSASHNTSSGSGLESKNSTSTSLISWEAQGGDTLQCNNPQAWAYTVGSFYNWRVVQQTNVVSLEDIISRVPGYGDIKEKFAAIRNKHKPVEKTIKFKLSLSLSKQHFYMTLPTDPKGESYGETIPKLVDTKVPLTSERMRFLGQLLGGSNQNVPLQLLKDAKDGTQEFAIVTDKIDESTKLRYNHSYKIRVADADESNARWLGVNPTLRGYVNVALLWAGTYRDATTVQFHSRSLSKKGQYIEPNENFTVILYDQENERLGYAVPRWLKDSSTEEKEKEKDIFPNTTPRMGTDIRLKANLGVVNFSITYL